MSSSSVPALFFSLFLLFSTVTAFNITKILSDHSDFSNFNDFLSKTLLAGAINGRQTITILAVGNADLCPLSGQSLDMQKKILSLHVILDYYDDARLQQLPNKTEILTTLYQTTGQAIGQEGFLNATLMNGEVVFGSAVPGSSFDSKLVKPVMTQPYNVSVLQVSSCMMASAANSSSNSISPSSSPATSPTPSPSPAVTPSKAPTPSRGNAPASAPSPSRGNAPASGPSPSIANAPTSGPSPSIANAPSSAPSPSIANAPSSAPSPSKGNTPFSSPSPSPTGSPEPSVAPSGSPQAFSPANAPRPFGKSPAASPPAKTPAADSPTSDPSAATSIIISGTGTRAAMLVAIFSSIMALAQKV